MKKIISIILVAVLFAACSADEVLDVTTDILGLEDKFAAEINGEKWTAEIRIVRKYDSPIDNFTLVGTSIDGRVLQISIGGVDPGTYYASLEDALSSASSNLFIATYTLADSDSITTDQVLKITSGTLKISNVDEDYISGEFSMDIESEEGNYTIKYGEFNELSYY